MAKSYVPPDTPLARFLRARNITGSELARRLGVGQPAISRAIRNCQLTLELAVAICDEVDPARQVIDERYLLLPKIAPRQYGTWPVMDTPRSVSPPA